MPNQGFRDDSPDTLETFNGRARLFPLPNVVLFPHVCLSLHVFEPRYRALLADAIASDRRITMVLLRPCTDLEYFARPPVHAIGCIGRVVEYQPLEEGKANIVLRGLARVQLLSEDPPLLAYRTANVRLLCDKDSAEGEMADTGMGLWQAFQAAITLLGSAGKRIRDTLGAEPKLGTLCDIAAHSLGMPVALQQQVLEELYVPRRLELIRAWLTTVLKEESARESRRPVLPGFSAN